mgnify:CR=1 FL=1|jgi:Na+-transporting NADH:ubiquinone oxidoreductase subunit NqrB
MIYVEISRYLCNKHTLMIYTYILSFLISYDCKVGHVQYKSARCYMLSYHYVCGKCMLNQYTHISYCLYTLCAYELDIFRLCQSTFTFCIVLYSMLSYHHLWDSTYVNSIYLRLLVCICCVYRTGGLSVKLCR